MTITAYEIPDVLLPLPVSENGPASRRACYAAIVFDGASAHRAGDVFRAQRSTNGTASVSLAVGNHRLSANSTVAAFRSGCISSGSYFCSAFMRASAPVFGFVTKELPIAALAFLRDHPHQGSPVVRRAELVSHRIRKPLKANVPEFGNGFCRDSNERIAACSVCAARDTKGIGQVSCESQVFGNRKLFGCNRNAGSIPRSIISNKAGQRNRFREVRKILTADDFAARCVEHSRNLREARNRDSVKPASRSRLPVAAVKVVAPLDRAGCRREPFVLLFQPFGLLRRVVTGQVKVLSRSRAAKRRVSEQRPNGNVLLELR